MSTQTGPIDTLAAPGQKALSYQVFYGFIPWIIFWIFSGAGLWPVAILGGLTCAAVVVVWRWLACGNTKTLELVALGYFALHACLTLLIGWPFLKTYGMVVNGVVLAGMAFGTLAAKNPFTYQYAKEEWDEIYWDDPEFYAINAIITAVWGGIFSLNALMGVLAVLRPDMRTWFSIVFPTVSMAGGIIFSYQFPLFAVRRGLQQRLDQWEPYKWPPPCFDARPTAEREHDVVVVGSGIGGLSAAALLARRRIMRKRSAGSATR